MTGTSPYAASALARECRAIATRPPGAQATEFNKAALRIGGFVASGHLPGARAHAALVEAGLRMPNQRDREPWTADALAAQVASAFRAARPRSVPQTGTGRAMHPAPAEMPFAADPEGAEARERRNIHMPSACSGRRSPAPEARRKPTSPAVASRGPKPAPISGSTLPHLAAPNGFPH